MNKALPFLAIMMVLPIGVSGANIEVRNASTTWSAIFISGPSPTISNRIIVEYANIIHESNLTDAPSEFDPAVSPRIMIRSANQLWKPDLGLKDIAFVDIRDNFFDNSNITVPVNTTVTWVNFGIAVHTVTADDGSFNSGNLTKDQSFSWTFNVSGIYKYHCSIHPSMTGTVIVTSGLKGGDLNNNGVPADAGDLVLMKRASIGEIQADSKYDLNNNGQLADAGDLVLMKRASIGEINL